VTTANQGEHEMTTDRATNLPKVCYLCFGKGFLRNSRVICHKCDGFGNTLKVRVHSAIQTYCRKHNPGVDNVVFVAPNGSKTRTLEVEENPLTATLNTNCDHCHNLAIVNYRVVFVEA
jgi:hypothetical protein